MTCGFHRSGEDVDHRPEGCPGRIAEDRAVSASDRDRPVRVEVVGLEPYEYSMEESVQIALENRLDLKNVRADVMDARRQIEVTANAR